MSDVAYLRDTELALMNAPFEADGWVRAIGKVAGAVGGDAANLAAIGGPLLLPLNLFVGHNSEDTASTFSRAELWGACNWRVQSAGAPMTIQYERHYAAARALGGTADYDDAVSDLDLQYGCQAPLISDERNFLGLAILRGRRKGPSDEKSLVRFRHLIRHVQRSVRVQLALDGEAAELMLGNMASLHCRTLLLDLHGCLCAMTQSAEALLEADGPSRLSGLLFHLRLSSEDRQFQAAMGRLLAATGTEGPQVHEMRVGRSPSHPAGQWRLSMVRLPRRPHGLGFDPQLALTFRPT
ncbi:MAG TPA: hypothetical protein VNA29_09650 [Sphingomicrobium sp.]|nr:hypothetical protein [Sphingomicrobium sp.]